MINLSVLWTLIQVFSTKNRMHTNNFKAAFSRVLFNELKNIINKNLCNLVLKMPLATLESIYLARKIKTRIRGSKSVPVVLHELNLRLISSRNIFVFKIWILITRISSNQIKSYIYRKIICIFWQLIIITKINPHEEIRIWTASS